MPLPASLRRRIAEYLRRGTAAEEKTGGAAQTARDNQPMPKPGPPPRRVVDMRGLAAMLEPHLTTGTQPGGAGVAEVRLALEDIAADLGLRFDAAASREALVLDIETLGLRSAPVFLVGVLNTATGEIVQLLAADYAAEPSLVQTAAGLLGAAPRVITYNGVAFDLPYLADRLRYWRLGELRVAEVLDVLAVLRSKRTEWPNLRLATLEEICLGRCRLGDIEARQLPALYQDAVRTGNLGPLARALAHNLMDLWACHDLATRLAGK